MKRALIPLALALLLPACADTSTDPGVTESIQVDVVAATTPFVVCGAEIPVTATVLKSGGRPYPGFLLNFNVLAGGGRMFGGAELTNNKGVAQDYWTVGSTADQLNTIAVRAVEGSGERTEYFTQTVTTLSRIAFMDWDGDGEIYVIRPDGSDLTRLTDNSAVDNWPAWSPDGTEIVFSSRPLPGGFYSIYVMDANGSNPVRLTDEAGVHDALAAWSPDGTRIAFARGVSPEFDIYVINADGSGLLRLTNTPGPDDHPSWSPDGSRIAFMSERDGNKEIYLMDADGSNPGNLTNSSALADMDPAWSPDGARIAFGSGTADQDIYVLNVDGSGKRNLTNHLGADGGPSWSPDGSRIVFSSYRDGVSELYVMNADGANQTRLTTAGALHPTWSGCTPF